MDKIAIFIENYSIGNSPSIVNLLDYLSDNYIIDLFLRSVSLKRDPVLEKSNIRVIELEGEISFSYLNEKIKSKFANYKNYICFEPHGFVLCKRLFPSSKPIYYSLELYLKDDHAGLVYPKEIMEYERKHINEIKGLIIQSDEKEYLFRKDYDLPDRIPSILIPVTYCGKSNGQKSFMIREKYGIEKYKKIALHLGGIAEWFSCIELALTFSKIENWVLLFHGYPQAGYVKKLYDLLAYNHIENVIISQDTYDSIEKVDRIIGSCDVGIAWYDDISAGFRAAGKSSGKIPAYLRFGLPVVAKKYESTSEAIANTGCGICVDTHEEIKDALRIIENKYEDFSNKALLEYDKAYCFDNYKRKLIEFIEK